jgi:hypothetical protein
VKFWVEQVMIMVCWAGTIAVLVILAALLGCHRNNLAPAKPQLPVVVPIAVVAWPSPLKPHCEVPDLPAVPDIFLWTKITDEEAGRVYVTQRQLADLVVWHNDVKHWGDQITKCVEKLSENH